MSVASLELMGVAESEEGECVDGRAMGANASMEMLRRATDANLKNVIVE